jgi:hypothetical protein
MVPIVACDDSASRCLIRSAAIFSPVKLSANTFVKAYDDHLSIICCQNRATLLIQRYSAAI